MYLDMLDMAYILYMHVLVLASSFKIRKFSEKLYSSPKTYRIHNTKILGWFLCLWKVNRLVCIFLPCCQAEPEGGSRGTIYIEMETEIREGLRG